MKGEDRFGRLSLEAVHAIRYEILSKLVAAFTIRRRMSDKFDGKKILSLPPLQDVHVEELFLDNTTPLSRIVLPAALHFT